MIPVVAEVDSRLRRKAAKDKLDESLLDNAIASDKLIEYPVHLLYKKRFRQTHQGDVLWFLLSLKLDFTFHVNLTNPCGFGTDLCFPNGVFTVCPEFQLNCFTT